MSLQNCKYLIACMDLTSTPSRPHCPWSRNLQFHISISNSRSSQVHTWVSHLLSKNDFDNLLALSTFLWVAASRACWRTPGPYVLFAWWAIEFSPLNDLTSTDAPLPSELAPSFSWCDIARQPGGGAPFPPFSVLPICFGISIYAWVDVFGMGRPSIVEFTYCACLCLVRVILFLW